MLWIALACLCWGIDNNLFQRLSLRNPLQISAAKALGAALPMLAVAQLLGALVAVALLGSSFSPSLLLAAATMAVSTGLLLRSSHGHWHRHAELDHQHRHFHAPVGGDAHHILTPPTGGSRGLRAWSALWHSHRHRHRH